MPLAAWQATIVDESGNIQSEASVEVLLESSGATAALFSDRDGANPISNPVAADADGFVRFYAAGNAYRINAANGPFLRTWRHVAVGLLAEYDYVNESLIRYDRTAAESAAGLTPVNLWHPEGHVYRWATNTNPGTADMTVAFQRAALTSLSPYAPADSYLITGSIPLRANQHWNLKGARINITGTVLHAFTVAAGINDWSISGGTVIGDNGAAGATSGSAAGVAIIDSMRWRVENFTAKNIRGYGILVQPGSSTSSRAEHGQIINPQMTACYRGIEIQPGTGAEYVSISNPQITRCNRGIVGTAGNLSGGGGGSVSDNTDGVYIGSGSNHGHGQIVGWAINHNTQYNVHCDNVTNGFSFIGCNIYGLAGDGTSAIFLDQCKGVLFDGGEMDCDLYNYKGASSGLNVIRGMYCPGSYGLKRLPGTNNGHDELLVFDCWGAGTISPASDALDVAGISMNDPAWLFVSANRAAASTQSLTSGVAADLIFNTEVSDRRGAYDNATGITTIPAAQGGFYRIQGDLVFSGTGMSATASYVELKIGSTAHRLFAPSIFSTTKLVIPVHSIIYLNAADTVKLTAVITGTTPVHGDPTYISALTVERLS